MSTGKLATAWLGSLVCLWGPAAALAAKAPQGAPPLKAGLPLWSLLCTIVALAGICAVVFRKPHRAQEE